MKKELNFFARTQFFRKTQPKNAQKLNFPQFLTKRYSETLVVIVQYVRTTKFSLGNPTYLLCTGTFLVVAAC